MLVVELPHELAFKLPPAVTCAPDYELAAIAAQWAAPRLEVRRGPDNPRIEPIYATIQEPPR